MKKSHLILTIILTLFIAFRAQAVVKYDEGRLMIDGVQLLQDRDKPLEYYYIPQAPRLATKEDGSFELLCLKFVGEGEQASGGIFHALVEFSLPTDVINELNKKLDKEVPGAKIVGPVPLQQTMEDGEDGLGSFQVVSAILNNIEGDDPFTSEVIHSGHAPLLPGSKAAIAARLNPAGATLLWESMSGPTSDVSVSIKAHYEAAVKGYNAIVKADVQSVYEHYSRVINFQQNYTKRDLRKITDELVQDRTIEIDVFDRSEGLGIDNKAMQAIVDLVSDKLVELMFDSKMGWAKEPERETAVEAGQIKGRQEDGWWGRTFGGPKDLKYMSDNQFVMKRREDIQIQKFYMNLSKSTTIKIPVYTSGNLSGIYDSLGREDEKYFRVVNLDDADFQKRDIHFQVDGDFLESFKDLVNFVAVNFKKNHGDGQEETTREIMFNRKDLEGGTDLKSIDYPRLGALGADWLDYEYQITWSMKGREEPIMIPKRKGQWEKSQSSAISLVPPFKKKVVTIDADRSYFKDSNVRSARIRFAVVLAGKHQLLKTVILRDNDAESFNELALYYDENQPIAYQVTWYSSKGNVEQDMKELGADDYLFLVPPGEEEFGN